ncbi:unnamed protein product [Phytomonas sp. Hart1]|nr:unnamed protein product [Phytomonas sp. Hart1]|eukprot:CCW68968.1 unnamed protein product [Phytomonas sp. isolate Hart1]
MSQPEFTEEIVSAKEAENNARRERLMRRSSNMANIMDPPPNFPPECCCIKPLIYHNIKLQIPVPYQRFMYTICGLYISLIGLILYNIVASTVVLIYGGSMMHFGLSWVYLVGLPGGWVVWYYNTYLVFTEASSVRRIAAIVGLLVGAVYDAWMAIGLTGFGGCGWVITIFSIHSTIPFIFLLVSAILWTLHAVTFFIMFFRFIKISSNIEQDRRNIYRDI